MIAGALTACAGNPTPDPWAGLEAPTEDPQKAVPLPEWPVPESTTATTATYTHQQILALDAYKTASEANAAIANEHAAQIRELQSAIYSLIVAGQGQRTIADMRQEMLQDERRHNAIQKAGLYAIILALGIAAAD